MSTPAEVVAYYEEKTEAILRRYGPGPRVHFHTGLVPSNQWPDGLTSDHQATLWRAVVSAQERLLERAAALLPRAPLEVLEVGCGLGGGALFWAMEHGAHVTAISTAPSQIATVTRFAAEAGVSDRVRAEVCDALAVQGRFDLVTAVESPCYLPRRAWMAHVHGLLRPGGTLLVADCLLGREELRAPFDAYWKTAIGTRAEYLASARDAGFTVVANLDLSLEGARFWTLTRALIEHELAASAGDPKLVARKQASLREHLRLERGLEDGGLEYGLFSFRRP